MKLKYLGDILDIYIYDEVNIFNKISNMNEVEYRKLMADYIFKEQFSYIDGKQIIYGSLSYEGSTSMSDIDAIVFSDKINKNQKHYIKINFAKNKSIIYELIIISTNLSCDKQWYGASGASSLSDNIAPKGFYGLSVKNIWDYSSNDGIYSLRNDLIRLTKYSLMRLKIDEKKYILNNKLSNSIFKEIRKIFMEISSNSISSRDNDSTWHDRLSRGMYEVAIENITKSLKYLLKEKINIGIKEFSCEWKKSFQKDRYMDQKVFSEMLNSKC